MKISKLTKTITTFIICAVLLVLSAGTAAQAMDYRYKVDYGKTYYIDDRYNKNIIFTDSRGGVFYYSVDTNFVTGENIVTKNYADGTKKDIVLSMKKKNGSLHFEECYMWNDKEHDGIFYVYKNRLHKDEYIDCYLVYDNSSGNNVFKLKISDIVPAIKKYNIKNDGGIDIVQRVGDKVMIMLNGQTKVKKQSVRVYVIYDINTKKIIKSNVLRKKNGGLYSPGVIGECWFDDSYIYVPYTSGKITKTAGKVKDASRQQLFVYNYSGKLINTIDYTDCVPRLNVVVSKRSDKYDIERIRFDSDNGNIYAATQKGIYKCGARQKKPVRIWDSKDSYIARKNFITGFAYTGNGKYVICITNNFIERHLFAVETGK